MQDDEPALGDASVISGILSEIIDTDILAQLRARHRGDGTGLGGAGDGSAEAVRLARLLLDDRRGFEGAIATCVARGSPWPVVASDILLPAARGLGSLWLEDACDFLDVTAAMGRLQAATQAVLPADPARAGVPAPRSALLAPAPGERHSYGLSLAAGFFRDAGWAVMTMPCPDDEWTVCLTSALGAERYDVLGLSLACDVHEPLLRRAVPLLRRASRNPDLRVIVGGASIARGGTDATALGVDACVADGRRAPAVAARLCTPAWRECP